MRIPSRALHKSVSKVFLILNFVCACVCVLRFANRTYIRNLNRDNGRLRFDSCRAIEGAEEKRREQTYPGES